ncbi:hypothetical protein Tco_0004755 [Tanacetum coccineum]
MDEETAHRDKHQNDRAGDENALRESEAQRKVMESYIPPILFPKRQIKEKVREKFRNFFENIQQLSINIPFVEALEQMPMYAKFMKDLLTNNAKFKETYKVALNERCSAILLNEIPVKEKDPRSFTIPCAIGKTGIDKALADLEANISLMPYSMFIRLELVIDKALADLEANISLMPYSMFIRLELVGNKKITFDIEKSMKFSTSFDDTCHSFDMADLTVYDYVRETLPRDQIDSFLFEPIKNYQPSENISLWEEENEITMDEEKLERSLDWSTTPELFSDLGDLELDVFNNPKLFVASTTVKEKQILKLKELPSHLKYAFLDGNQEFPVIISSLLSHQEKDLLS